MEEKKKLPKRMREEIWNFETLDRNEPFTTQIFFWGGVLGPLYTSIAKTIDNLMCPPTLSLTSYQPTGQNK